jgi:hypothetical protein
VALELLGDHTHLEVEAVLVGAAAMQLVTVLAHSLALDRTAVLAVSLECQ